MRSERLLRRSPLDAAQDNTCHLGNLLPPLPPYIQPPPAVPPDNTRPPLPRPTCTCGCPPLPSTQQPPLPTCTCGCRLGLDAKTLYPNPKPCPTYLHVWLPLCVRVVLRPLCELLGDHKGRQGQLTARQRSRHTPQLFMHRLHHLRLGLTCVFVCVGGGVFAGVSWGCSGLWWWQWGQLL